MYFGDFSYCLCRTYDPNSVAKINDDHKFTKKLGNLLKKNKKKQKTK